MTHSLSFKSLRDALPEVYSNLLPRGWDNELPSEGLATCSNCAMAKGSTPCKSWDGIGPKTFKPELKCCTFLIPHQPDLKADQRFDYVVSVRKIEKAAGINFMPALGANDDVEKHPSDELLDLLQKN